MALLEIDAVTVTFGGHDVMKSLSLDVDEGSVTGLIGPNGAGKTTLFNVIGGLLTPDSGRVRFAGRDITDLPPFRRAQVGLARTFQRLELFTSLSVRENIQVAGEIRNRWSIRALAGMNVDREVDRVIELVGLTDVADRDVSELPTGRCRLVELARALMSQPRMVLLDEPASGQDDRETHLFGELLHRLADDGVTVLLVEHDMSLVMSVCEQIHVLDFGHLIASGAPAEIQANPVVLDAYLGAGQ